MTAPSVREVLELAAGILQDMIQRGQIVVGITGTNAYYIGEGVMPKIAGALATPPAPTPSAARERIARIIDPHSFLDIPFTDDPVLLGMVEESKRDALRKADAILALLPDEAAIYVCYDGYGDYFISRERPASHVAIVYDEDAAEKVVDLFNSDTPDAAAIRAAVFEEAAKIAEQLAAQRRAKERSYGYGPEAATPVANLFWCEEIAAAIRAAGENAK